MSAYRELESRFRRMAALGEAAGMLHWDMSVLMPSGGVEARTEQLTALKLTTHEMKTDPALADLLDAAAGEALDGPWQVANLAEMRRIWVHANAVDADLVEAMTRASSACEMVWREARPENDYARVLPYLEEVLNLSCLAASAKAAALDCSPYEALLDEYEPDAKVENIQQVFDDLRTPLVKLIAAIKESPQQPDTSILERTSCIDDQRDFSHFVAEQIGFDFERGRLDETSHPFCTTLGPHDCRILTRYDPHWLPAGLFGTMHEAGHGMYEQGLRPDWFGLPPGSYVSLGIHESQSRLWENQVGRSRPFWEWLYPQTNEAFQSQLDGISLDTFYFAINTVRPSLIRVEADEATYNLHIIIRFDLEQQLIDGSLKVKDLPEAWNSRYQSDLGICPPSDADGVLQDVHWSAGLIGYFPTYTLGNAAAAQLFNAASEQIGDLDELFARGEFRLLLDWLRERIHFDGRCYSGSELIERATGTPLSATHLVNYLKSKLEPLYGITDS